MRNTIGSIVALLSLTSSLAAAPAASPLAGEADAPSLGAPPPAGSLFLYPERIPRPAGRFANAERGMIFVPTNRSDPESAVIGVEIYRFRALETADPRTPPIFLLRGGPGFRGLERELHDDDDGDLYGERILPFLEIADLVVVGQRGIGSSKPDTVCEQGSGVFSLAACKSFWEKSGLDLSGLSVIEAAADVRDVALALGYDGITLYGHSFGSHWGMAVMRYHPGIVRRAVLSGMEGPDHTYDMPGWVLASLRRMAEAAESSPRLAGHIPEGGLIAALQTVIARAREQRLSVTVEDPATGKPRQVGFGASDVQRMALGYTARVSSRSGMPTWPADILALYEGDYARAAEAIVARGRGSGGGGRRFRTASYFMLDCGSGISEQREKRLDDDPAIAIVGNTAAQYKMSCPLWRADLGEAFREGFDTDIPTVMVHGTWDVSTPYENALELAPRFKQGKLVPVVGGSHGALREAREASSEFDDALAGFLRSGDLAALPDEVVLPPIEWEVPGE